MLLYLASFLGFVAASSAAGGSSDGGTSAAPPHLFPIWRGFGNHLGTPAPFTTSRKRKTAKKEEEEYVGLTFENDVTIEEADTNVHVKYSASIDPSVHLPLLDPTIATNIGLIECKAESLLVELSSEPSAASFARFRNATYISGACTNGTVQEPVPFYRKVVRSDHSCGAGGDVCAFTFTTEIATLQELFTDLAFRFTWSPPHKSPTEPSQRRRRRSQRRHRTQKRTGARTAAVTKDGGSSTVLSRDKRFLDKIGTALNNFGESASNFFGDVGEVLVDVGETIADTVVDVAEDVAGFVSDVINGDSARLRENYNLVNLNYDSETKRAANQSIPLFHSPWARCVDCYVNIDLYVDLSLSFGSFGVPKAFHAEAGGEFQGKLFINITNPTIPAANGMGNWHKLMPRVRFGSFTFMVGPVPIVVGVDGQLNGMAVVDRDISASVSMGAEMAAEGRFGVDWQKDQGWEKIADASWKFTYWEPAWDFGLDDEGATVTASISPEVIVTLWEVIPLVVKPKPYVSARFGRATEKITPEDVVDSLQCDRLADTYALEAGLDLGVGIKDIAVPDLVPFVGGVVLIKEKDFGQFPVVPATAFGQCGPLCAGCLPGYKESKVQYLEQSYGNSANKVWADANPDASVSNGGDNSNADNGDDDAGGATLGGGATFGIVLLVLVLVAVIGIVAYLRCGGGNLSNLRDSACVRKLSSQTAAEIGEVNNGGEATYELPSAQQPPVYKKRQQEPPTMQQPRQEPQPQPQPAWSPLPTPSPRRAPPPSRSAPPRSAPPPRVAKLAKLPPSSPPSATVDGDWRGLQRARSNSIVSISSEV